MRSAPTRRNLAYCLVVLYLVLAGWLVLRLIEFRRMSRAVTFSTGLITRLDQEQRRVGSFPSELPKEWLHDGSGFRDFQYLRGEYVGTSNRFVIRLRLRFRLLDDTLEYGSELRQWWYHD